MNQLTTIANVPSGAGQAAHPEPEVGTASAKPAADPLAVFDALTSPDMLDAAESPVASVITLEEAIAMVRRSMRWE